MCTLTSMPSRIFDITGVFQDGGQVGGCPRCGSFHALGIEVMNHVESRFQ
jgi:hypothetical protein